MHATIASLLVGIDFALTKNSSVAVLGWMGQSRRLARLRLPHATAIPHSVNLLPESATVNDRQRPLWIIIFAVLMACIALRLNGA